MPRKNPEQQRAYMKAWMEKNADKVKANRQRYEQKNREKLREYHKRYYQLNREKIQERERERRAADPAIRERKRILAREWARAHPDRARLNARRGWARRKYGLSIEEVDAILERGCAICGSHKGRVVGKRGDLPAPRERLCLDHDHTNGKVRDALCHGCNSGLGLFGDDPERLRAAAQYLESHS